MTPDAYWTGLVKEIEAKNKIPYGDAWLLAGRTHPDANILMQAFGAPKAAVQFYNSKLASAAAAPTKAVSRREFREAVQARMKDVGCDYDTAFNHVQTRRPDLVQTMSGTAFANAAPTEMIASPQTRAMLCLPQNCSQEEFDAALAGNGGVLAPRNPGKIFAALVELEEKKTGAPHASAVANCKARYTQLWDQVKAIVGK